MIDIQEYTDGWSVQKPGGGYYFWFPEVSRAMLRGDPYPKRPQTLFLNPTTGMVDRYFRQF